MKRALKYIQQERANRSGIVGGYFPVEVHHSQEDLRREAGVSDRVTEPQSHMGYLVICTTDNHVVLAFTRPINNDC